MKIEFEDSEISVDSIIKKMKIELNSRNIEDDIDDLKLCTDLNGESFRGLLEIHKDLELLNLTWNNPVEYTITSHRRFIGKFIVFGKKVVRKFLRWYINPIIISQNEFNAKATRIMNAVVSQLESHENIVKELKEELNSIKLRHQLLEKEINRLKNP